MPEKLTVEAAQDKRRALEATVLAEIQKFEKETGAHVLGLELARSYAVGARFGQTISVTAAVQL